MTYLNIDPWAQMFSNLRAVVAVIVL